MLCVVVRRVSMVVAGVGLVVVVARDSKLVKREISREHGRRACWKGSRSEVK